MSCRVLCIDKVHFLKGTLKCFVRIDAIMFNLIVYSIMFHLFLLNNGIN